MKDLIPNNLNQIANLLGTDEEFYVVGNKEFRTLNFKGFDDLCFNKTSGRWTMDGDRQCDGLIADIILDIDDAIEAFKSEVENEKA